MANLNWLWLPFVPCILVLAHFAAKRDVGKLRQIVLSFLLTTSAAWVGISAVSAYRNSVSPREFDFQLYWIYGSAIHDGYSPYNADALKQTAAELNPSPDMLAELLFLQTPPSAFLYAPLGAFDIQTACVLWYVFQAVVIAFVVILSSKTFFPQEGMFGVALCTTLLLSSLPARDTIWLAQTNFMILLTLLLFWRSPAKFAGGFALGTGILIKPILALFPIYLFLTRQWKPFFGVIAAGAALSLAAIAVFGPDMYFAYFLDNPIAHQMPSALYSEGINQSLLATILRILNVEIDSGHPAVMPMFVVLALGLSIVSGWVIRLARKDDAEMPLSIVLTLSLLLFPKTLSHYSVLLIVPMLLLWSRRHSSFGGAIHAGGLIVAVFALCAADHAFVANLLSWCFVCGMAFRLKVPTSASDRERTTSPQLVVSGAAP